MGAGRHCMAATHDAVYCGERAMVELKWIVAILLAYALFACVLVLIGRVSDELKERRGRDRRAGDA